MSSEEMSWKKVTERERGVQMRDLVTTPNLEHARAIARAAVPRIHNTILDREELEAEAALSLTKAAAAWLDPANGHNATDDAAFHKYFSHAVKRAVSHFITNNKSQISVPKHDVRYKNQLFAFANTLGVAVSDLSMQQLHQFKDTIEESISDERLLAIRDTYGFREESLDRSVFESASAHELVPARAGDAETGEAIQASHLLDPEAALIQKQEGEAPSDDGKEQAPDALRKLISYLPKPMRQVMSHKHLYSWNRNQRSADSKTISNKKYGGTAHNGLSMSPEEIDSYERQATDLLREFAHGDFSKAEFEQNARTIPKEQVSQFMETLPDNFHKTLINYGLLREGTQKKIRNGKEIEIVIRRNYKHVAKKWAKRLLERGDIQSLEEADVFAKETQNNLYKDLLIMAGRFNPDTGDLSTL